jgi:hypothetical protein
LMISFRHGFRGFHGKRTKNVESVPKKKQLASGC